MHRHRRAGVAPHRAHAPTPAAPRGALCRHLICDILIFQMPVPERNEPVERDLLRERAYLALRDAIVDGTLAPGERLRDVELTRWLGLSRTPVREALARLELDGLVETAPQRFTRVTPLDRRAA